MVDVIIKKIMRKFGVDIKRYSPVTNEAAQLMAILENNKINTVFDVGANIGQFGKYLRGAGYNGRIISFEPLELAWEKLYKESKSDKLWTVCKRTAIGDIHGEIIINVAGNSASSSILNMLEIHKKAAPISEYVGREKVELNRLDTLAQEYILNDSNIFVKIDTQGYEDKVLIGAEDIMNNVAGIQIELSLIPLYEGQCLYDEMIEKLKNLGFKLWGLTPAFIDPANGRLLQIDATFFK